MYLCFISYDYHHRLWYQIPSMESARAHAGCAVYRDKIYVIGNNVL